MNRLIILALLAVGCGPTYATIPTSATPTIYHRANFCEAQWQVDAGLIEYVNSNTEPCYISIVDSEFHFQIGSFVLDISNYETGGFQGTIGVSNLEAQNTYGGWNMAFPDFDVRYMGKVHGVIRGYVQLGSLSVQHGVD